MEARELRIGNYLQLDEDTGFYNQQCEIASIDGYEGIISIDCEVFDLRLRTDYNISELEPIPLTEEWLLRFGFYLKCKDSLTYAIQVGRNAYDDLKIYHVIGDVYLESLRGESIKIFNNVYYVHQLQNLYFALTSEELKLQNDDKRN
jgi:hypothetical protein